MYDIAIQILIDCVKLILPLTALRFLFDYFRMLFFSSK